MTTRRNGQRTLQCEEEEEEDEKEMLTEEGAQRPQGTTPIEK
jgi:hypothetical protein